MLAAPAHAGLADRCVDVIMMRGKHVVDLIRQPYTGDFQLTDQGRQSEPFEMSLVKELGSGWYGGVSRVGRITHPALSDWNGGPLVVKIPHSLRKIGADRPFFMNENAIHREVKTQSFIMARLTDIKAAKVYPKSPAWTKAPLADILLEVKTEIGTLLFKPEIRGEGLNAIAEKYGTEIPPEMEEALHDIYDFGQAIYEGVRIGKKGYAVDIRQSNAIWISDPATLALFGYTKPGFILVEADQSLMNYPQFNPPKTTWEDYLRGFKDYISAEQSKIYEENRRAGRLLNLSEH